MYSPKIREDLVPRIYRAAKSRRVPMTTWINQVVEQALADGITQNQLKEDNYGDRRIAETPAQS